MKKNIEGGIIAKFTSKKGKIIELRIPKLGDEKQYQDFINGIIAENDYILVDRKITINEEKKWLDNKVKDIKAKKVFALTSYYNNIIIGQCNLEFGMGRVKHCAKFGINISKNFRGEGIGNEMMKILFLKVKKMGIKIVELEVFATNIRAINAYKKQKFIEFGVLPKSIFLRGKYVDTIYMYKNL